MAASSVPTRSCASLPAVGTSSARPIPDRASTQDLDQQDPGVEDFVEDADEQSGRGHGEALGDPPNEQGAGRERGSVAASAKPTRVDRCQPASVPRMRRELQIILVT